MSNVTPEIIEKAKSWLSEQYDEDTRRQVKNLIDNDPNELTESFYRILEFGTGGLRGIMGVGTNRMNIYTVAMATQGLANYIKKMYSDMKQPQVAIAYDCRNNSREFAKITADVMTANGIKVFLFSALRPTPELSFAIRELKCQSGVVVTASHNPKEYNGYKVYWEDGGQVVAPHDKNIIAEVTKITDISMVNRKGNDDLLEMLDEKFDDIYLNRVMELSLSPKLIKKHKKLSFVYTPIHGTGGQLMPKLFAKAGFKNFYPVEEQMITDGNFPTVVSPNPEEHAAMTMALDKAKAMDADVVIATDPDADRVGVAVKNDEGEFILLNGNQTASILTYYILSRWDELGKLTGKEFIVKTIVTSDILIKIADKFNVKTYDVLTGFKYIADKILNKPEERFVCGGEESYGFLVGDFVRDKDAIITCFMIAEATAWAAEQGKTLYQVLKDIYNEFGVYREKLVSLTKKGISGIEEIKKIMLTFRANPPKSLLGSRINEIRDYKLGVSKDLNFGIETIINLPKSDVLQFFTEDGIKVSVRPSGTEPKIKFYFSMNEPVENIKELEGVEQELDDNLEELSKLFTEEKKEEE
ncbi:MAG: phospho-sugar mutase [bacterium]|nr:phospho-sugar mutase [Candidatus Limimorpha caballi]MCQ2316956.1 phospho-sugar mutase [Bacteroidales bacterium]